MSSVIGRIKAFVRPAVSWTAMSLLLNLAWEIAQLPLYTISQDPNTARIVYSVLHCTVGDAIIAAASFILTSVVLRDPEWVSSKPWQGSAITALAAVAYTGYSEWHNVYGVGAWGYLPAMPLVFGIGLSPLLQWLVIPFLATLLLRAFRRRLAGRRPTQPTRE